MLRPFSVFFAVSLFAASIAFAQEQVTLEPSKDNTLYQSSGGTLSNGAGQHIFVGTTNAGALRRALLAFDLEDAQLPAGAEIQTVTLDLNMSRTIAGSREVSLHRVSADWGEGASEAAGEEGAGVSPEDGDATWIHRFFDNETWAEAGGDFEPTASATFSVGGNGSYSVSSEGMADDVRAWLNEPSSNFGWILLGDESQGTTAKRFDSREHSTAANRPQLTISYMVDTATERPELPRGLRLAGNYPNPFARSTTIHFEVDRPQDVSLTLYDLLGREVRALVRGYQAAGPQDVTVSSDGLTAGTYLYCFDGAGRCERMTVIP